MANGALEYRTSASLALTVIRAAEIRLYESALRHIAESHPTEYARLGQIHDTIERPTEIYESLRKAGAFLLVSRVNSSSFGDPMSVAVKVRDWIGYVDTAHYASNPGGGGALIWRRADD